MHSTEQGTMRGSRISEEKSVSERRGNRKQNDPLISKETTCITLRAPDLVKQRKSQAFEIYFTNVLLSVRMH